MKIILLFFAAAVTVSVAVDLGHVENCRVTDFGTGYLEITWDFVEGDADYPLHKYSLTADSDLTSQFKCGDLTCSRMIEGLDACIEHTLELTPLFYDLSGDDMPGDACVINGYTTDELPGPIRNIRVTAETNISATLKWSPPIINPKCADSYDVCLHLDETNTTICKEANSTTITMDGLEACGVYIVTVTPLTQSGFEGPQFTDNFTSHDGVPGKPQDVTVGLITKETIQLLWNDPLVNPLCVENFVITIGETHPNLVRSSGSKAAGYDHEFTFKPLTPCTNYTIDICSANLAEETSGKVIRGASTEETDPLAPPFITVHPSGPNSIDVSWGDNEGDNCAGSFQVCWNDGIHPIEKCQEIDSDGDNSFVVDDLLPCTEYDISVGVNSPNGTYTSTNTTSNSTFTQDVRPSPVVDLQITSIDVNQLTIQCELPIVNPQCVKEIATRVIDEDLKSQRVKSGPKYEETFTGLKACTDYRILVSTKSPSGLESEVREIKDKTLDAIPSEPQEFEVTDVASTSITFQWFQPATNPRCASDYYLTWTDDTTDDTVVISDASTFKVEYTLTGLELCTNYNFTLNAESSVGAGPETTLTHSTAC